MAEPADLVARRSNLSPEKRRLLEARLRGHAPRLDQRHRIPRRRPGGPPVASFAQDALWILGQLDPDSLVHNRCRAFELDGPLDVTALEAALGDVLKRHEGLRTAFQASERGPLAVIDRDGGCELRAIDLSTRSAAERGSETERLIAEARDRTFDVARPPLLRATVLIRGSRDSVLIVTTHHLVTDGWSDAILLRDLSACYAARAQGESPELADLPIQYADFAAWQRGWLQGDTLARLLAYWKARLAPPLPVMELPLDRPRPPIQTSRGARHRTLVPRDRLDAMRALGSTHGASLFMTLLASFYTLLHRHTGQDDLIVGTPVAGRARVDLEPLVGCLVNTLVLRTDVSDDPAFTTLLERVRAVALGAYEHQDLPIERLVVELHPERSLGHRTLFQVMFALRNLPAEPNRLGDLALRPIEVTTDTAHFDLTLEAAERHDGLACVFEYNTDLFDATTIDRMAEHWRRLLEEIAAAPHHRLSTFEVLTPVERQRIVAEWNPPDAADRGTSLVHDAIDARAIQRPDHAAIIFGDQTLTYRDLTTRANRLAHHLRSLNVGRETIVAVLMERSADASVALTGVMKAGAAFLPLDPAYPPERLAYILDDSQASVVLADPRFAERIPAHTAAVVLMTRERWSTGSHPTSTPNVDVAPEDLAYVIYTSGSTGRPKGVLISHSAFAHHVADLSGRYPLTPADRVLHFSSLTFDTALEQIFPALTAGATVVVRGTELWSPAEFLDAIARLGITVADLPTSYWRELARGLSGTPDPTAALPIRVVTIGGEAAEPEDVRSWHATPFRSTRLWNMYGPSETTISAIWYEIPAGAGETSYRVPIGRPLAGTQAYVLDRYGNTAPIGVRGELCIGGVRVGLGYLNRPDLTAERFVPDHLGGRPGTRLYRTGDLARYRPDGVIEFLGRADHQVKVRGFRVELEEIEAVLLQYPAVRQAVASLRASAAGEVEVVAYLTGSLERSALVDAVHARRALPDYMVPPVFVVLDQMPMTAGGKVDRRALPPPDFSASRESRAAGPRTPIEAEMAEVWRGVLGRDGIGIHDNFFDLGGHSLLATRLMARLHATFGVDLPLRNLFEAPSIAALAERVQAAQLTTGRQARSGDQRQKRREIEL